MKIVKVQRRKSDIVVSVPKEFKESIEDCDFVKVELIDGKICYSKIKGD